MNGRVPDEAVGAAAWVLDPQTMGSGGALAEKFKEQTREEARRALEAAAPHLRAQKAVDAILGLHREMPCLDEEGDPVDGSYCEECKDADDDGERVHEVYPCMTVREITKAFAGQESYAAMRDKIEGMVK